jgi:hypothetical protein
VGRWREVREEWRKVVEREGREKVVRRREKW